MKTTVEINGYVITIEENENVISVSAEKEGEVVEEFTLDTDGEDDEFSEFDGEEEEDFGGEDTDEEDMEDESDDFEEEDNEEEDNEEEDNEEEDNMGEAPKLESFRSWSRKSNRK